MIHVVYTIRVFAAVELEGDGCEKELVQLATDKAAAHAFITSEVAEGNFEVTRTEIEPAE